MQIDRLRLAGFKSFVDPTELTIAPGLTGIVGPNGCGKSNLVEALRWVMGEASAKRLRGGEMDDVIFAGSDGRPARNIAEVAVTLDNSARDAPPAFNDRDVIQVERRIERRSGSSYRINGREARARDVQLLFADAATGPLSGAMVGQGRIAALIDARPSERRLLLDEAAGTAGLQARRHEAELKLRAAEDNLLRLDDVLATLAAQLDGLNRQARTAQRYRRLGEQIRRAEAQMLDARWHEAAAEAERIAAELRAAERDVAAAIETAAVAERARTEAEDRLQPLRLAEAEAAAAAQRIAHAREALEQELSRIVAARAEAERRLAQSAADLERESGNLADGDAALARLADERRVLERDQGRDDASVRDAASRKDEAEAQLAVAETGLLQMTEACATGEARRAALGRERADLAERRARIAARRADIEHQRRALADALVPAETLAAREQAVATATAAIEAARGDLAACTAALAAGQAAEAGAVDAAHAAERDLARLKAEAEALAGLAAAAPDAAPDGVAILSLLDVPAGFEAAVAALCDGELVAPLLTGDPTGDKSAAAGWVELAPIADAPALPDAARPLAAEIAAPPALGRLLAQAGWVDSEAAGRTLQPQLRPGQSLVDRDGRLWRWDGFTRRMAAPSATAQHLRHRNRLAALAAEIATAEAAFESAAAAAAAARAARQQAAAAERDAVARARGAEDSHRRAEAEAAALARRALDAETRLATLDEAADKLAADLDELAAQASANEHALAALPDPALARAGLDAARTEAAAARRREGEAHTALDRLIQQRETRRQRLAAIADEAAAWDQRRAGAATQRAVLDERRAAVVQEIAALDGRPTAIAAESRALVDTGARAAAEHRRAADALALAETRRREAGDGARRAELEAAERRERRARLEARRDAAAAAIAQLRAEIAERLGAAPERLSELAGREPGAAPADPEAVASRLDRLLRERDGLGPVNLVAEAEAAEVEARIAGLTGERDDLTAAIARLRRGIGALDQEAQTRIVAALARLNVHFADLFARLFGGGKAQLAFTADSDPLEAGLEVMVSPPGKRHQMLSLLSGGEQALAALALVFAVFLTNPAPICMLDEVDAALDDANIDRFCGIVAETARATGTRFLLITHHRITMARMDRLYGLTMPERGVSQLVSVDLAKAAEWSEPAVARLDAAE